MLATDFGVGFDSAAGGCRIVGTADGGGASTCAGGGEVGGAGAADGGESGVGIIGLWPGCVCASAGPEARVANMARTEPNRATMRHPTIRIRRIVKSLKQTKATSVRGTFAHLS
jgi:hypothetical protein